MDRRTEARIFIPQKVERISEWHVAWLAGDKRTEKGIEGFPKHPQETDPNE